MQDRDVAASAQDRSKPGPAFKVISGVIERITYQDEETGYTIARLLPDPPRHTSEANGKESQPVEKIPTGEDHLVTVIGTLLGVVAGEALELTGFWQHHTKHGWQFNVQNYRSVLPATIQGLRKYLGSGLIKGIGPKTAAKIVARFDLETLEILEQHQERLLEVPGLGQKRAQRIAAAWEEQKAIKEVMVCLQGLGADEASDDAITAPVPQRTGLLPMGSMSSAPESLKGSPGEQAVYLLPFYAAEQGIARNLLRLAQCPPERGRLAALQQTNFSVMFEYLATKAELTLADRQQDGIVMALTHPVGILTGGPGTGKTTSLRALIRVLTLKKREVILAAPTGRAAKRLSEATGLPAKTLHRLLQLRPGGNRPTTARIRYRQTW